VAFLLLFSLQIVAKGVRAVKKIVIQLVIIAAAVAAKVVPLFAWGGGAGP
jgi:hypothetical protein